MHCRRHYETNRAPLGLYFHTLWFKDKKNQKAFKRFLADMVNLDSTTYSIHLPQSNRMRVSLGSRLFLSGYIFKLNSLKCLKIFKEVFLHN